jgi:hypothetical protein
MKANVVKMFDRKVWVESDIMGDKHVMVQHQDGESEPFCYCSFHYDSAYTSNITIRQAAENMAIAIGASEPVEHKPRPFNVLGEP